MIKKFGDYEQTKGYSDGGEQLPRGGYVCKIIGAKVQENEYGQSIKIAFDIAEGEYKDYFQKKYDANTNEDKKWPGTFLLNVPADDGTDRDKWSKRKFRTFTDALEDSNAGYHFDWDEGKFKNKLVGFVFNYREWQAPDGRYVMSPNVAKSTSVDKIRKGSFKVPEDRLKKKAVDSAGQTGTGDFNIIPEGVDEEIPF
jgi:hypothetical protein